MREESKEKLETYVKLRVQNELLSGRLNDVTAQRDALRRQLAEAKSTTEVLRRELDHSERHIKNLEIIVNEIHSSRAWKIVKRYYRFKDIFKKSAKQKTPAKDSSTVPKSDALNETVSVVIPTKNAGDNFWLLMSNLCAQKGVKPLDLIIVDSGSTDQTCKTAEEYGARVIKIDPEDFSHSYSRNLGVSEAKGEYTLLLTQDALPCSDNHIRRMLDFIKSNNLSAATCFEYPRTGCNMTHSFFSFRHMQALGYGNDDIVCQMTPGEDFHEDNMLLRKKTGLNNVCCLVHTKTAAQYKYKGDYAEDLELGIRLYKDNHRLGFMQSCKILHSHNRPPSYFLKRSIVDIMTIIKLLDLPHWKATLSELAGNTMRCYTALSHIIPVMQIGESEIIRAGQYRDMALSALEESKEHKDARMGFELSDQELLRFINEISRYSDGEIYDDLRKSLIGDVVVALDFVCEINDWVDSSIAMMFSQTVVDIFAWHTGQVAGCFCLAHRDEYDKTIGKVISISGV